VLLRQAAQVALVALVGLGTRGRMLEAEVSLRKIKRTKKKMVSIGMYIVRVPSLP
jgi:hypothetical protein